MWKTWQNWTNHRWHYNTAHAHCMLITDTLRIRIVQCMVFGRWGVSGSGGLACWAWCSGEGWAFICFEVQCDEFNSITETERRTRPIMTCYCISDSLLAYGLKIQPAKNRALYYDTAFPLHKWLRQRASMLLLGSIHTCHAATLPLPCHSPTVPNVGRSPTRCLWTADSNSHIPCRSPAANVTWPWEVALRTAIRGVAGERHGMCESNTAALCKSMGKTLYKHLVERRGMCESMHGLSWCYVRDKTLCIFLSDVRQTWVLKWL
jgi:hypothetical protein